MVNDENDRKILNKYNNDAFYLLLNVSLPTVTGTSNFIIDLSVDPDSFYRVVKNKVEVVGYNIDSGADSDATFSSESSTGK